MRLILIIVVRLYRGAISPLLPVLFGPGPHCRFEPSCSRYAEEAVRRHGAWRGGWLTLRRLARCHPWGGCGCDLVPEVLPSGKSSETSKPWTGLLGEAPTTVAPGTQRPEFTASSHA